MSEEDRIFLQKMKESKKMKDGHYELQLPHRNEDVSIPDNRRQALYRAGFVKKKLLKDQKF